jgi:hypothetical protein
MKAMSKLSLFLKQNKTVRENVKYAATKSLCDEKGVPLEWELKPLSTAQNEAIQEACMTEVPVKGKPNMFRPKLDTSAYMKKSICACVVEPDLHNVELQNSYGVMTPEDLLMAMVDNPAEYQELAKVVQKMNGFDVSLDEKVDEAKNS